MTGIEAGVRNPNNMRYACLKRSIQVQLVKLRTT